MASRGTKASKVGKSVNSRSGLKGVQETDGGQEEAMDRRSSSWGGVREFLKGEEVS